MCGIFGVAGSESAATLTAIGLHVEQHRAIDYAGMATVDDEGLFNRRRGAGLSRQFFTEQVLAQLRGKWALGHIRYPTVEDAGRDDIQTDIQPLKGRYKNQQFALVHNGTIANLEELETEVPLSLRSTSLDTEVIVRLIEKNATGNLEEDLQKAFLKLKGSFTLGILMPDCLIAVCDPSQNRPLSIGKLLDGGYCITSETCVLPNVRATFVQDVAPGTMVFITKNGLREVRFAEAKPRRCIFEKIYLAHPGSVVFDDPVHEFRMRLGQKLEEEAPVEGGADVVAAIPDSANFIAMGYGMGNSGDHFPVVTRNHYIGRTFIAPTQALRDSMVANKFTFIPEAIKGKRIVLVDDSIVRGTTTRNIAHALRHMGAAAVHVRIGSPPIISPCKYGVDTRTHNELVMSHLIKEELRLRIGADSLEFISMEGLQSLDPSPESYCYACFNGQYWHEE